MQERKIRRSNRERSEDMRRRLLEAARALFIEKSYAETSTPDIVAAASVTRGALYHHFADKAALFHAVLEAEAAEVAAEVEAADNPQMDPLQRLLAGSEAYLAAMSARGRTRLLLLDGPAVLGSAQMEQIDARHAARTLREGLAGAMEAGLLRPLPLDTLTSLLAAMFDRASIAIERGEDAKAQLLVISELIGGLRPR